MAAIVSKASTDSMSHATGGPNTLLRHWSRATEIASSSVGAQLRWICEPGRAPSAGVAVGVENPSQGLERLVDGDEPVGPVGVPGGRLWGDGGADERRDGVGQRPQPGAVHRDEAVVADLLAGQHPADDVDALAQPLVADLLARPLGPVTRSLLASPEPSAAQNRPGNMLARVAIAWAMIAGW